MLKTYLDNMQTNYSSYVQSYLIPPDDEVSILQIPYRWTSLINDAPTYPDTIRMTWL